jgi:hypothetical protein
VELGNKKNVTRRRGVFFLELVGVKKDIRARGGGQKKGVGENRQKAGERIKAARLQGGPWGKF